MFGLDNIIISGVVKSCTVAGAIFGLGILEGLFVHVLVICFILAVALEKKKVKR